MTSSYTNHILIIEIKEINMRITSTTKHINDLGDITYTIIGEHKQFEKFDSKYVKYSPIDSRTVKILVKARYVPFYTELDTQATFRNREEFDKIIASGDTHVSSLMTFKCCFSHNLLIYEDELNYCKCYQVETNLIGYQYLTENELMTLIKGKQIHWIRKRINDPVDLNLAARNTKEKIRLRKKIKKIKKRLTKSEYMAFKNENKDLKDQD